MALLIEKGSAAIADAAARQAHKKTVGQNTRLDILLNADSPTVQTNVNFGVFYHSFGFNCVTGITLWVEICQMVVNCGFIATGYPRDSSPKQHTF